MLIVDNNYHNNEHVCIIANFHLPVIMSLLVNVYRNIGGPTYTHYLTRYQYNRIRLKVPFSTKPEAWH